MSHSYLYRLTLSDPSGISGVPWHVVATNAADAIEFALRHTAFNDGRDPSDYDLLGLDRSEPVFLAKEVA